MKLTRFSIAGLMGLVLAVALMLVGLKEANPTWSSAIFAALLLVLILGVLNAIQGRGRSRAFWTGFAISGWACLFFTFGTGNGVSAPSPLPDLLLKFVQPYFQPQQITFQPTPLTIYPAPAPAVATIPPALYPTPVPTTATAPTPTLPAPAPGTFSATAGIAFGPPSATTGVMPTTAISIAPVPTLPAPPAAPFLLSYNTSDESYRQVGYCLATILMAYLGGLYSLYVRSRREREEELTPSVSPSSP